MSTRPKVIVTHVLVQQKAHADCFSVGCEFYPLALVFRSASLISLP